VKPQYFDLDQAVHNANQLRKLLNSSTGLDAAQMDNITRVMEDMLIAMIANLISMGFSSFECPDVAIRLPGWRKQ
jgi:hypothetical protein